MDYSTACCQRMRMDTMPDDCEGAVREVAQVYELIKTKLPLFLLHQHGQQEPPLAQSLLSEALRALNIALSAMTMMQKRQQQREISSSTTASPPLAVLIAKPQMSSPSAAPAAAGSGNGATTRTSARSGKRRRSSVTEGGKNSSSSWVNVTTVPYEDGYEWRKYGEKSINGAQFTRSYFRCAYKDDTGCLATKYVQQMQDDDDNNNSDNPPVFQVTYNSDHTCNCTVAASGSSAMEEGHINKLPMTREGDAGSDPPPPPPPPPGGHQDVAMNMMTMTKQEETVVLPPPLADVSVEEDSSSFRSSSNELDMARIMAESPMGDDPELQLLYNTFKYY